MMTESTYDLWDFNLDDPLAKAVPYIQNELQVTKDWFVRHEESPSLAGYLHALELPLDSGHVTAYIPFDSTYYKRSVKRLDEPPFGPESVIRQVKSEKEELLPFIVGYLSNVDRYAVFQEMGAQPGDTGLDKPHPWWQFFIHGPRLYNFVPPDESDVDRIAWIMNASPSSSSWPALGVLTSLPEGTAYITHRSTVPIPVLRSLAERATHLLIGAFDGSGWLLWHRPEQDK